MIKLKWGDVNNRMFTQALNKLVRNSLPMDVTIKLLNIAEKCNKEETLMKVVFDKLNKEHSKKDETGKMVIENNQVIFKSDEAKLEFEKGFQEAMDHEFKIRINKFPSEALKNVHMTVQELWALKPLLSDGDMLLISDEEEKDEKTAEPKEPIKKAPDLAPVH